MIANDLNLIEYISLEFSPVGTFPEARKVAFDWIRSGQGVLWNDWTNAVEQFSPIALQFGLYSAVRSLPPEYESLQLQVNAWVDCDGGPPIGVYLLDAPDLLYKKNYGAFIALISTAHLLTGLDWFEFEYRDRENIAIRHCVYDRDRNQWEFVET